MKNIISVFSVILICILVASCGDVRTNSLILVQQHLESEFKMSHVPELNLYVDTYEISIDDFCKEFDGYFDILIERAQETNHHFWLNAPRGNYPAIVTYNEAKMYAKRIDKRLPTMQEWDVIAKGKGVHGTGNYLPFGHCSTIEGHIKQVDTNSIPNGYSVYQMIGNVTEWCDDEIISGVYFAQCGSLIRNWFPKYVANFDDTLSGFRLVKDIEK